MNAIRTASAREQLFNFLSMSSDIARNQRDSDFADRGGQIIYTFDSTVFSLFYDTIQWRSAVSSFYGEEWAINDTTQRWKRIESQSALIASEYLLSEDLPGAKNRKIYLTSWHRTELARASEALSSKYLQGQYDRAVIEREIKRKMRLLSLSREIRKQEEPVARGRDDILNQDLDRLRSQYDDDKKLARYEVTRRAAATLVQCELSERLDQIHRLVSSPLRQRIHPVHEMFDPNDEEVERIRIDAEEFFEFLQKEITIHQGRDRHHRESPRTPNAIWNDAKSIAFIKWASSKIRSDQRIVLVTSDDVVFDAYRRWWADSGIEKNGETQEFLLRRSFQYTPIFNLRDAKNDISENQDLRDQVQKLFFRIKEAIYTVLIPFNLVQIGDRNPDLAALAQNRQFEYMAIRAKDYREDSQDIVIEHYMSQLDSAWYDEQSQAIDQIADLWREIERIGIGFFYEQVRKRLEDDERLYGIGNSEIEYEELGDEVLGYLARSLDQISNKTREAYLPIAESYLRQLIQSGNARSQRAPETIWYRLPNGLTVYEMIDALSDTGKKRKQFQLEDIQSQPEAPFMLAAGFATRAKNWWKAEELSEYALWSCRAREPAAVDYAEVHFVNAVAKRFRLGALSLTANIGVPSLFSDRSAQKSSLAVELHDAANTHINSYLHQLGALRVSQQKSLYEMRGRSERAALHLFLAAHHYFNKSSIDPTSDQDQHERVLDLIGMAEAEIAWCRSTNGRISSRELRDRRNAVSFQVIHNSMATSVLRYIVNNERPDIRPKELKELRTFSEDRQYSDIFESDTLVQAEQYVFFALADKKSKPNRSLIESTLRATARQGIALDRAIAEALIRRIDDIAPLLDK